MAAQGLDYRAILGFYFTGVTLHPSGERLFHEPDEGVSLAPIAQEPRTEPSAPPQTTAARTKRRVGW